MTADAPSADEPPPPPSKKADKMNAHTFGQVAVARGSKWAEASMAALHKKERAQAVQILQLRQDLERAQSVAETSTRELAELKQQVREQVRAPSPTPLTGGVALPRLTTSRERAGVAGLDAEPQQQPAARSRRASRPASGRDLPSSRPPPHQQKQQQEPASSSAAADDARPPSSKEKLRARMAELEERCAEAEAEAATSRGLLSEEATAAKSSRLELDAVRSELARLAAKHEGRMSTAREIQRTLEGKLAQRDEEVSALSGRIGVLEDAVECARADGRLSGSREVEKRVGMNADGVQALRTENARLTAEVASLTDQLHGIGGRIKTLSGQTEASSAEERNFLRTLHSLQKEQDELERDVDIAATVATLRSHRLRGHHAPPAKSGGGGTAGGGHRHGSSRENRMRDAEPLVDTHDSPLKPQVRATNRLRADLAATSLGSGGGSGGSGGGALAVERRGACKSAATSREAVVPAGSGAGPAPPLLQRALHPPPPPNERRVPAAEMRAEEQQQQQQQGSGSPRREPKRKAVHAKAKHEILAELDPEGAERKKAIDALRARMKAVVDVM
jgi:hypothetical protein